MKRILFICMLCFFILLSTSLYSWKGSCLGVVDGKTILVLDRQNNLIKIKLYGIEVPEDRKQKEYYSSKEMLGNLIYGSVIEIQDIDLDRAS